MKDFKENNCRVCTKVFCCKICREKHENKQHNIFPGCEICVSGQTLISSTDENVITHIKKDHWPLHCVYCKRLFGSVDEIFQHKKCPLAHKLTNSLEKSPYTPYQSNVEYTSPFFLERNYLKSNLATSTPMQAECKNLEKVQEVIVTPIDCSESKETNLQGNYSSISFKRKVTFCDTPITHSFSKKYKSMTSSVQAESTYYTATEQDNETPERIMNNLPLVPCIKIIRPSPTMEDFEENKSINDNTSTKVIKEEKTIWISAVNISSTEISTNISKELTTDVYVSNNHFITPMVPKGRKIIAVTPNKKKELRIKFEGPVQISSTPNSSMIPVKSAPNIRDIFQNIAQMPSTSKSDLENWSPVQYYSDSNEKCDYSENSKESISSINASVSNKLWNSVSQMVKNVLQGFSNTMDAVGVSRSLKRHSSDPEWLVSPMAKRYKFTNVQCRRNIRDMTPFHKHMEQTRKARSKEFHVNIVNSVTKSITKTFADKATQTDESNVLEID